jgi:DNA-binding transcriptional MerR regulator
MELGSGGLTIQEFARATGLTVHTLRYYERIGLIQRVARARSGHRRYSEADGQWIAFLNKLRATGMSIRDMRVYAELQRRGDATLARRVEMLERLRDQVVVRLAELQENLELVRYKIRVYGEKLAEQRGAGVRSRAG